MDFLLNLSWWLFWFVAVASGLMFAVSAVALSVWVFIQLKRHLKD